jgi:MFS family permease
MVLFFILNKIKRKPLLTFFVSLFVGLGTSFFIYPKYLFLHNSLQAFFFVLFLYSFLLFEEKKSKRRFIIFTLSSLLFIISWQALSSIVIAIFMAFWFTYFNFERINRRFYIAYIFVLGVTALIELKVFLDFFFMSAEAKPIFRGRSLFYNLYNESFHTIDFVSVSLIYSTNISNALFLKLYPLFGFFFGAKGIFVNSPFLLFSLPGIIAFNNKRLKTQLLALLIFFILAFAYFHADYEGGFSPRYVRHSEIIIVILTIFLASYFSKLKNKIILLIFILFVSISVTNSISLAIRTDWSYEKITDLVSYDIVLWPWLPFKQESIALDLKKVSEQSKWNFTWEAGCDPLILHL